MRNLIKALVVGILVCLVLYLPELLSLSESVVPGVLGVMITYFILARGTFKKAESTFTDSMQYLQKAPPRFDLAIQQMEAARPLGRDQFGIDSQIDSQIGVLYFLQKQYNQAVPYLERSLGFGHWMGGAMLGVIHYKKKNHDEMKKTFEVLTKKAKKQSLVWNLYAYLLCQIGEQDKAQALLVRALKPTKDDPKVKESLTSLQNGKKIKMKAYKEQWYQFHLENPPKQYQQTPVGGKMSRAAVKGRW
ncbi:MAG: hypothetical protein VYA34_09540 [Myxococcota bacterium]|nr:hypothetical protein [Myxococcota bacterium]